MLPPSTTTHAHSSTTWLGLYALLLLVSWPGAIAYAQLQPPGQRSEVDSPSTTQPPIKIKLPLRTLTAQSLHTRLEKVLRRQLATSQDASGQWLGFYIDQAAGQPVTVWANSAQKQVELSGPASLVQSWQKVLSLLDQPTEGSKTTQLVATKPGSKAKIKQAANKIKAAGVVAQNAAQLPQSNPTLRAPDLGPAGPAANAREDSVGVSLLGPVQIETVEGTDILLLRGNPRDVQRVLDVINQIEQMAEVGDPEIEVVALEHVEAEALATLMKQIFSETLNSDKYGYGSLGIYPLSQPNSVLLIALPTTMQRAKETLAKLDRPGQAASEFETIPLKHAKAADAKDIVQNLFNAAEAAEGTSSLAPQAQVIADNRTNALIVRASPRDLAEVRSLLNEIDRLGSDSINELRVFKLKSSVASDLKTVLSEALTSDSTDPDSQLSRLLRLVTIDAEGRRQLDSGVLADAKITSSASANALIISAPGESMPLLEALIAQLDQAPDAAIELKIFPLENGDAAALSEMLTELFGSGEGGNNQNAGQAEITRLRIEVDERTNSILAAGTRDDLVTVEAILRTLDLTDARQRQNRVYRLKNKFAPDVAEALNAWLRAERDVQGTAPGTVSPFQQIEREVVVVPEFASNSLIVSATPRYYDEVARLIQELDAQDPMVMIQVLIAEIELGDIDEFGVELGLQDSVLFDRSLLGDLLTTQNTTITNDPGGGSTTFTQDIIQSATNTPGFNFGDPRNGLGNAGSDASLASAGTVAAQGLASFGVNRVSPDAGFGGLVLSASSNSVSMLLRALQESRRLEVLSRPQIMALDNQLGTAFVGQIVPFITASQPNQFGQPTNQVERIQVGLDLQVTPRISPDGLVVMDVFAANNRLRPLSEGVPVAVSPNGDPILQPIQDAIQARTTVSAVSGQTIVLSGLITKEDTALHRRVPLLADIPLLGDLFRFDSVSTRRRELLIIMTPHVVRGRFEAEMLKQVESARMNWCLSDVVDLHGPAGLRSATDREGAAEAETVYPTEVMPQQFMPASQLPTPAASPQPPYTPNFQ